MFYSFAHASNVPASIHIIETVGWGQVCKLPFSCLYEILFILAYAWLQLPSAAACH